MDFFKDKSHTIEEVDEMVKEFLDLKNEAENIKDKLKMVTDDMELLKRDIITAMQENSKTSWDAHGFKLSIKTDRFPKLIKDPEEFKKLEAYLKEVGGDSLFYSYSTINAQSLRSLVKYLQEERPNDIIPCVDLSFERDTLSVRKAK